MQCLTLLLEKVCLRDHRTSSVQQGANLAHGVEDYLRARHVSRILSNEAVQRVRDLCLDLVHQLQTVRPLTAQVRTRKRQVGRTGEEKGHTVGFLCKIGRRLTVDSLIFWKLIDHRTKPCKSNVTRYAPVFAAHISVNTAQFPGHLIELAHLWWYKISKFAFWLR